MKGTLQGGDLDRKRGVFAPSLDKLVSVFSLGSALLASDRVTEFELRPFVGKIMFCLAFRRPFDVLSEGVVL